MKGLLLEELSSRYFINLQDIFGVIGKVQKDYNWLISNYECNIYPSKKIPFDKEIVFIEGEELEQIVTSHEIQFIWGVFSGFKKEISLESILEYPIPFADGNKAIWNSDICTQNPLADIEIIAWDSTLAVVVSKEDKFIETIKKNYPTARDLLEYNLTIE